MMDGKMMDGRRRRLKKIQQNDRQNDGRPPKEAEKIQQNDRQIDGPGLLLR